MKKESESTRGGRSRSLPGSAPTEFRVETFVVRWARSDRAVLVLDLCLGRSRSAGAGSGGSFPEGKMEQSFWYVVRGTRDYRAYRRGRENEPGGIGTVTIGFPSVGMGSSLPEARTGLKGVGITCSDEKARTGHRYGPAKVGL